MPAALNCLLASAGANGCTKGNMPAIELFDTCAFGPMMKFGWPFTPGVAFVKTALFSPHQSRTVAQSPMPPSCWYSPSNWFNHSGC